VRVLDERVLRFGFTVMKRDAFDVGDVTDPIEELVAIHGHRTGMSWC
jgi:hypothetical protein